MARLTPAFPPNSGPTVHHHIFSPIGAPVKQVIQDSYMMIALLVSFLDLFYCFVIV
jgi:hypothetical protein